MSDESLRFALALVLAVFLGGCVRVTGSSMDGPSSDSRPVDGIDRDAGADAVPTDLGNTDTVPPDKPFGPALALEGVNDPTLGEDDPCVTGDMLELYFERDGDLWISRRTSTADPWPAATRVAELNTTGNESSPAVSADGLRMIFARNAGDGEKYDIYVSTRESRIGSWRVPSAVAGVNSSATDAAAVSTADLLVMIVGSDRSGGLGDRDLWIASRDDPFATFTEPINLAALNSSSLEDGPWISGDGQLLFFRSNRAGGVGLSDIWFATRTDVGGSFSAPALVPGVNTSEAEGDPWLSPDLRTIYFTRNVGGQQDLFVATR